MSETRSDGAPGLFEVSRKQASALASLAKKRPKSSLAVGALGVLLTGCWLWPAQERWLFATLDDGAYIYARTRICNQLRAPGANEAMGLLDRTAALLAVRYAEKQRYAGHPISDTVAWAYHGRFSQASESEFQRINRPAAPEEMFAEMRCVSAPYEAAEWSRRALAHPSVSVP